jgi:pSer/pThr/pTyr-binding forkhead associated (FHA) protein/uncharacterized RDD family membrane protein YckC
VSGVAKLVVNPTSASKKEIPIASRVISIGRDPSNDLVLSDSMVSRRHAILEQRDDIFVLRDNNSSNGTLVNGDKVEAEKTLRDGDLVAIGSSRLLFQLDDGAAAAETESPPEGAAVAPSDSASRAGSEASPPGAAQAAKPAAAANISCPSCGKKSLLTDRFCRACGSELEKKTSVACTACGKTVPLPAEFCGHCGHELPKKDRAGAFATRQHASSELLGEVSDTDSKSRSVAPGRPRPGRPAGLLKPGPKPGPKEEEPAGFGVRLVAAIVDSMILGIPLFVATLIWTTFALDGGDGAPQFPQGSLTAVSIGFPLICLAYYVLFWAFRGATPGKSLLGLSVETDDGDTPIGVQRAVVRMVGYWVSSLILGLGFVMIAFSDDKRALHDRIAGTRVMRNL